MSHLFSISRSTEREVFSSLLFYHIPYYLSCVCTSHRVELFELCAMTLIDTWVKAKGQSTHFSKNDLIKILRPLAFWMHQHPAVGAIPGEELHEQIVQQLIARSINEYDATKLAEQFLEIVRGKTGILVERGKESYGFLHLTFEEYFA